MSKKFGQGRIETAGTAHLANEQLAVPDKPGRIVAA
jgi:hypothetical protein